MRTEPHRLVFIDETGTNTKMTRARGRCDRGERLRSKAPFGHWKTQTFVAKLKAHLRAMAMRTIDELWKAIGQICDLFTPQQCANYFKAAGYAFT